jgi:Ser/Thr protein kinase RdoA (MazF antagonist)
MPNDENMLIAEDVTDRPRFSTEEARETALRVYGLDGSVRELPSEHDQNFLLGLFTRICR